MVSDNADKLTPKQQRTIAALLSAPSIRKASEDAGVPERTVYDWLKLPAFKGAYREAQREAFKHSMALTQRSDRQEARIAVVELITANTSLRMHRKEISSNWTRLGSQTLLRWDEDSEPDEADVQKALDRYFESVTPFLSQFPELLRHVTRT